MNSKLLSSFISTPQLSVMISNIAGEEGKFFTDKLAEIEKLVGSMHKTYEQDGKGEDAIVHLHYFNSDSDWFITEKDMESDQLQAFGFADRGHGGELGYINIMELTEHGVELDLHWTPKTLREAKAL